MFSTLLDSYTNILYPFDFDSTRVPQDPRHMPRNFEIDIEKCDELQKVQLAQFWFADCYYMRGMNDSNDMTINLATLHQDHPEIFHFATAAIMSPETMEGLLLDYHLPIQHKQISRAWVENAKRMTKRYDGDPRKIFENFGTYATLVERIANDSKGNGFIGFQKKMTSMLGYYYMATGIVPYQNIPLPVDFHVMRIAISQELITFEYMADDIITVEKMTDLLREMTFDYADRHGISQLTLCNVLWLYSREACVHSPTNAQPRIGPKRGRATVWAASLTNQANATAQQVEDYQRSCGICPLRDTCKHNIPNGPYYVSGVIRWPNKKVHLTSAQDELFSSETLSAVQQATAPAMTLHEIDRRDQARANAAARRVAAVRRLAHPALIPLSPDQILNHTMVEAAGGSATSLSGKKFAFTDTEVTQALGDEIGFDALRAIDPYRAKPNPQ